MEKKNVPKIRFPGFTEPWKQHKLGDYLTIPEKIKAEIKSYNDLMTVKLNLGGVDIGANRETLDFGSTIYYKRKAGQFIYGKQNFFNGSMAIVPKRLDGKATSGDVPALDINGINSNYLYIYVSREDYWKRKEASASGTGSKRIHEKTLFQFDIDVPSLKEQEVISLFFIKLDNLITLHQHKLEHLKKQKKGLLQKMFPKNGEKVPEIRFPGFTDDWEQRKLEEFVSFFNGLTYTPNDVRESGTLVLRSSNVKDGEIVEADNVYVDPNVVNSENVKEGDIIVVVRNGSRALIGKHAEIKTPMPNTVIGAFMTGIRSKHSSFVNALLDTSCFENEITMNMGATINQITGYMFSKMKFYIPNEKEQEAIGEFFKQFDNLITLHQRKLEHLQKQKKALLQQMFL